MRQLFIGKAPSVGGMHASMWRPCLLRHAAGSAQVPRVRVWLTASVWGGGACPSRRAVPREALRHRPSEEIRLRCPHCSVSLLLALVSQMGLYTSPGSTLPHILTCLLLFLFLCKNMSIASCSC